MPMPTPNKDEDHDKFMDRCMGDETMNSEFEDDKQRYAVCLKQWEGKDAKSAAAPAQIERRVLAGADMELRIAKNDAGGNTMTGYAAVFNADSVDLGGFIERILPGAFSSTIQNSDIRALVNHDPNLLLGRNVSKTLRLKETAKGLQFEIDLPDTQLARDTAESIRRGDMSGCSFAFITKSDKWHMEDGKDIRELVEIDPLYDVGPVTYPAYPDTSVAMRSLEARRAATKPPVPEIPLRQRLEAAQEQDRKADAKYARAKFLRELDNRE